MVLNYDVPHDGEDYVHRIGRTARAAAEGTAITFVSEREQRKLAAIEKLLGKPVPKVAVPEQFGEAPAYNPNAFSSSGGQRNGPRPQNTQRRTPR